MSLFSFKKIIATASVVTVVTSIFTVSANAQVMGTAVALSDRQCIAQYRTTNLNELLNGGCFDSPRPYTHCTKKIKIWKDIETLTNSKCLSIFADIALNDTDDSVRYNDRLMFTDIRQFIASSLVRNEAFLEVTSKLDKLELEKIAQSK